MNDQIERPRTVFRFGIDYLITKSHQGKNAKNINGTDGVYGYVSNAQFHPYKLLNGSGLVLDNSVSEPFQTYAQYRMPNGLVPSYNDKNEIHREVFK